MQLLAAVDDLGQPRGALTRGEEAQGADTGLAWMLKDAEMAGREPQGGCGEDGERDVADGGGGAMRGAARAGATGGGALDLLLVVRGAGEAFHGARQCAGRRASPIEESRDGTWSRGGER